MSTEDQTTNTEVEPLRIGSVECSASLPAALWRALSIAERPEIGRWANDITVVHVDDEDVPVTVLPQRHYVALIRRLRELEQQLGECLQEDEAS